MEKKTITITKDVFVANDGKEFVDEYDCLDYEREQEQERVEKEVEEKLGFKTQVNFPSMLKFSYKPEYKLFLIKNESDLDLFVETYEYWFTRLGTYSQVNKETFQYPDVLCILDFPRGEEEHRLYKISQLCGQFNDFVGEISAKVGEALAK